MRYLLPLLLLISCGEAPEAPPSKLCEYAEELRDLCESKGGIWTEQIFMGDTWILFCDTGVTPIIQECCACG